MALYQTEASINFYNNLFQRTRTYIHPNHEMWDQPTTYIPTTLNAYNNLTIGGVLRLVPPSTGEPWTFKDNMFDGTAFEQLHLQPITHDHNGYSELTPAQLSYWYIRPWPWPDQLPQYARLVANDTDGTTDATNDRVLTAAPAYQTGPLGNYYLQTSSTLWNAGSRTAADAGLFHYTTRVDQTKEGSEGSGNWVNIGLHYVATANSSSTLPKDTETPNGDGLSDYAEDANGDGIQDGEETDWQAMDTPLIKGGAVSLNYGQVLSGRINISATGFATSPNNVRSIELLDTDIVNLRTSSLGVELVSGSIANATFDVETSNMRNGVHLLQVRVTDDNSGDNYNYSDSENSALSLPVNVSVQNGIFLLDDTALNTSWKFHLEFGTTISDGSWRVEIRDDAGSLWKAVDGDIASSRTANGTIEITDLFTDDGAGGSRPRTPADEYPGEHFDVVMFAQAAPTANPELKMKYIRTRIAHRPNVRLSCVLEAPMISVTGLRNLMDGMMDEYYVGMSILGRHFKLAQMATEMNQTPGGEGWNFCNSPQLWINLNMFLAGAASDRGTHLFSFAHGSATGFGQRVWTGAGDHVDASTLQQYGYWQVTTERVVLAPPFSGELTAKYVNRRGGLTFCFLDACNAGNFVHLLMVEDYLPNGNKPSLADLLNLGKFPYYGCGWTKTKQVAVIGPGGIAPDVLWEHADYAGRFVTSALTPDLITGLPKLTYKEARDKARYYSNSPTTVNPWSGGWKHVGCDDLYIDE